MTSETSELLADLEPGKRTMSDLPYGGFLVLEHDVPALLIYRKKPKDKSTMRLARTGASYLIIGDSHFEYFRDFRFLAIPWAQYIYKRAPGPGARAAWGPPHGGASAPWAFNFA